MLRATEPGEERHHAQIMKPERFETLDALLSRYVAGALPLPAHLLVEAHLELRGDNRGFVAGLEDLAGEALDEIAPVGLGERDRRLETIFGSPTPPAPPRPAASGMPAALRDFIGHDLDELPWRTRMPGFREFDAGEIDGCHVNFFWIKPGRAIPSHTHEGSELSLVLDGAFNDVTGRYGRGDISIADETVDHRPVAENKGPCIVYAVTDAPLRLTGSFTRRLTDILGM